MLLFIARISYVLFIDFAQEEGHFFSSVSFTIMALLVLKEKTQKRALFLFCSLIFPAVFIFFFFFFVLVYFAWRNLLDLWKTCACTVHPIGKQTKKLEEYQSYANIPVRYIQLYCHCLKLWRGRKKKKERKEKKERKKENKILWISGRVLTYFCFLVCFLSASSVCARRTVVCFFLFFEKFSLSTFKFACELGSMKEMFICGEPRDLCT